MKEWQITNGKTRSSCCFVGINKCIICDWWIIYDSSFLGFFTPEWVLTLFRMGLFGAPTVMKLGTVIPYLKEIQKSYNHLTHPLSSADISIFHQKSAFFIISRNTNIDCILIHNLYLFLIFLESLKVVLINMLTILMISAKLATLGFLKSKLF